MGSWKNCITSLSQRSDPKMSVLNPGSDAVIKIKQAKDSTQVHTKGQCSGYLLLPSKSPRNLAMKSSNHFMMLADPVAQEFRQEEGASLMAP